MNQSITLLFVILISHQLLFCQKQKPEGIFRVNPVSMRNHGDDVKMMTDILNLGLMAQERSSCKMRYGS